MEPTEKNITAIAISIISRLRSEFDLDEKQLKKMTAAVVTGIVTGLHASRASVLLH
jgi:hypothetical protein